MDFEGIFFDIEDYELTSTKLGSGTFGTVYLTKCLNNDQVYAIKLINLDNVKDFTGKYQMQFMRESLILRKLQHPAIVGFIGINFQSFNDPQIFQPTIITEYVPKGSLKSVLNLEKASLSKRGWNATKRYISLLGISSAMRYMHKHGLIHRDLKPENVLIDEDLYPRVCDFGLSRSSPKKDDIKMTAGVGTPLYFAPEIQDNNYGPAVDVYAFALIAYEIMVGKEPFSELKIKDANSIWFKVATGYRPPIANEVNDKMKKLISDCWCHEADNRPSFEQIFSELSTDFSYMNEYIDEDEVKEYIKLLDENSHDVEEAINDASYKKEIEKKELKKERKCYSEIIKSFADEIKNMDKIKIKGILNKICD